MSHKYHRSKFGDTHKKITRYFNNYQIFGFTGTAIFVDDEKLNKY